MRSEKDYLLQIELQAKMAISTPYTEKQAKTRKMKLNKWKKYSAHFFTKSALVFRLI